MNKYLIEKAKQAGFEAWTEDGKVAIKLPMAFFGHDKSHITVQVANVKEYKAIMGDD